MRWNQKYIAYNFVDTIRNERKIYLEFILSIQ